jgi:dTDP-4-dehydrorhamnose reductase
MRIAIMGGTGLLGSNLVYLYTRMGLDVKAFSRRQSGNITKDINYIIDFNHLTDSLDNYFDKWNPDVIINTIANINLEDCEKNQINAYFVNCTLAQHFANIAKKYNSYYIHISTDHYFNDVNKKHTEFSNVQLLNVYAHTKYQAEQEVLMLYGNSLIVRTNIVGFRNTNKQSFFEWLVHSLKNKIKINLFTNFYTSPISVDELGVIIFKVISLRLTGIYNIASREIVSKYDFGIKTAKKFNFNLDSIFTAKVSPLSIPKRALTLGLDVSKIEKASQIKMPSIDETLEILYSNYKDSQ